MARVRQRSIDVGRLSDLVARPGIDPRYHVLLAVVDRVVVDPDHGIFCDITLLPNEESETALMGLPYAGNNYGFYFPLQEEDLVVVAIPNGDTGNGPVIISRVFTAADVPFSETRGSPAAESGQYEPAQEVVLRARPGTPTKIIVSEGANITLTVEGSGNVNLVVNSGNVHLGKNSHLPTDGVVHGSGFDTFTGATYTALQNTSSKVWAKKS
jgi:uncharacterized protein involved in type VI secretion and phage assembly